MKAWRAPSLALLLLTACSTPSAETPQVPKPTPAARSSRSELTQGLELLRRARYSEAEPLLRAARRAPSQPERAQAELGLARLALKTGRLEATLGPPTPEALPELRLVRAEALRRLGRLAEAKKELEPLLANPSNPSAIPLGLNALGLNTLGAEALLARAELEHELGERAASQASFEQSLQRARDLLDELAASPRLEATEVLRYRARSFAVMARAAFALRDAELSNEAWDGFEEASQGQPDPELLAQEARLYARHHDAPAAYELLKEALAAAPNDPDLLAQFAELKLHELFDFSGALNLAEKALATDPQHARALAVVAGVALRDLDFPSADASLELGLRRNPRELSLLGLRAARHFLAEEPEAFEATLNQLEELSPGHADVYAAVAELGDFEHRFSDVITILRRGVARDREDGRLRAELGLALSRSSSDAAGLLELQAAFRLDSYNRRVFNSLELYEKIVPRDYDEFDQGHFHFRVPKAERRLLERYVPQLLEAAYETYRTRYGYEPPGRITVELYQNRQDFAVRTSGLPEVGLEGVCFGRKIATVSPGGGAANVGMTLWHEMAHVFHLGLSQNRVPRWLTEGLAEWETERLARGWSRELDLELYRALRDSKIPELGRMNRAFTRASSLREVSVAYAAAGRLAAFLSEEDEPRTQSMLSELGKHRPLASVLADTLGPNLSAVDERFRAHLAATLDRFKRQFVSQGPQTSAGEAPRRSTSCEATERAVTLEQVRQLLETGDVSCHLVAMTSLSALFVAHPEPEAGLLLARLLEGEDEFARASLVLDTVLKSGVDGVELAVERAKVALAQNDLERADQELELAVAFDPKYPEAWLLRGQVTLRAGRGEAELEALRHLVPLEETNPVLHERFLELLVLHKKPLEAARAADNAIWPGLGLASTHRAAAKAYGLAGAKERARFEDETARWLETPPDQAAQGAPEGQAEAASPATVPPAAASEPRPRGRTLRRPAHGTPP